MRAAQKANYRIYDAARPPVRLSLPQAPCAGVCTSRAGRSLDLGYPVPLRLRGAASFVRDRPETSSEKAVTARSASGTGLYRSRLRRSTGHPRGVFCPGTDMMLESEDDTKVVVLRPRRVASLVSRSPSRPGALNLGVFPIAVSYISVGAVLVYLSHSGNTLGHGTPRRLRSTVALRTVGILARCRTRLYSVGQCAQFVRLASWESASIFLFVVMLGIPIVLVPYHALVRARVFCGIAVSLSLVKLLQITYSI